MSRRPPPKGEIVPEQRVRFQEEFEAIPLREPLPPPPQYHYQQQYQQPQQHVSPHMLPRNASPQQVSPQLPSQNASPHMQPKLQVSPQKQPRNASPRSASPRNASPHSRQPQAQAQAQPAHHRRPSKEGLATHLPPKGDHVRRSTSTAGVSHRQLERLRQAFVQFDTNHSGTVVELASMPLPSLSSSCTALLGPPCDADRGYVYSPPTTTSRLRRHLWAQIHQKQSSCSILGGDS